jgi:Zn-dependent protease with chaperone function
MFWLEPAGGLLAFAILAWQLGWWPLLVLSVVGAVTFALVALALRRSARAGRRIRVHSRVERDAARITAMAGLPPPEISVLDEGERPRSARALYNASAIRFGRHSQVFITPRLAEQRSVLPAVLAHETGHLRAGAAPSLVQLSLRRACTITALLWGTGTTVAAVLHWDGGEPLSGVITRVGAALALVAVGYVYEAWASRSQEFAADQDAAALTSPAAVARALDRIVRLEEPAGWRPAPWLLQMFSSHPTVQQRIERLERLHHGWTGEVADFAMPPTIPEPGGFPLSPDEGLDEPDLPFAAKAAISAAIGALYAFTAYVGIASLVWLAQLPRDRPASALMLGALFVAASGVAGWLIQQGLQWWARRHGPAWDAWGNPAWPGRRAPVAEVWMLRCPLAGAALLAAANAGMALWHPAIAYFVLTGLAVLLATGPLGREQVALLRIPERPVAAAYSPAGRARTQALHLTIAAWSVVLAVLIVVGQSEAVKVIAVIAVGCLAVIRLLWPVRPLRRGEADTTPGGPPPPGYQPVRPIPRHGAGADGPAPGGGAEHAARVEPHDDLETDRDLLMRKARCPACGRVRLRPGGSTTRCECGARIRVPAVVAEHSS